MGGIIYLLSFIWVTTGECRGEGWELRDFPPKLARGHRVVKEPKQNLPAPFVAACWGGHRPGVSISLNKPERKIDFRQLQLILPKKKKKYLICFMTALMFTEGHSALFSVPFPWGWMCRSQHNAGVGFLPWFVLLNRFVLSVSTVVLQKK